MIPGSVLLYSESRWSNMSQDLPVKLYLSVLTVLGDAIEGSCGRGVRLRRGNPTAEPATEIVSFSVNRC
jgi:hypothetical protein